MVGFYSKKLVGKLAIVFIFFNLYSFQGISQEVQLLSPHQGDTVLFGESLMMEASAEGVIPGTPAFLRVIDNADGYRKLKFGNNPNSVYGPAQNVMASGNNTLKITLRDVLGSAQWNRIKLRPNASGNLYLNQYVDAAGGVGGDWTTISIPLEDFDASIDFTSLAYFEFPYSADADDFTLDIAEVVFTGGAMPYLWFGEGKTDNAHNGDGNVGELLAEVFDATPPIGDVQYMEFFVDGVSVGQDATPPYSVDVVPPDSLWHQFQSAAYKNDGSYVYSEAIDIFVYAPPEPEPGNVLVSILNPSNNDSIQQYDYLSFSALVDGASFAESPYLSVWCTEDGYRKLKLGNNATSIYGPGKNVVFGGNDTLIIELRDVYANANWSKIRIRPQAIGTLSLSSYVNAAGGPSMDWLRLRIPLSDFSSTIDFTDLDYIEFPYSAGAGFFQLEIKEVSFVGGSNPYTWFGYDQIDNAHNGNGGAGEINAEVIVPDAPVNAISEAVFYLDNMPFDPISHGNIAGSVQMTEIGAHTLFAEVLMESGELFHSDTIHFIVPEPATPISMLSVHLDSPDDNAEYLSPAMVSLSASIGGFIAPEPMYMRVSCPDNGYRKLKISCNEVNVYAPKHDVTIGGNDTLEIIIKDIGGSTNWSKIRLRPEATGSLYIKSYIDALGSDLSDWTTIRIPLSDFDPAIDFTNISLIEFPYSAGAGIFVMGIKSMRFTGGSTPFVWFNEDHSNVAHNGNGGGGELTAELMQASPGTAAPQQIDFMVNDESLLSLTEAPYTSNLLFDEAGEYWLKARLTDSEGLQAVSDSVLITITDEVPAGTISFKVLFDEVPSSLDVEKAVLRFNKMIAYSFTLDDGRSCAYTNAYPLFEGGYVAHNNTWYPGLNTTDGCGNDIPFRASLAWYSVNSSYSDLHVNTPSYIKWSELSELYNHGWEAINHSYSHSAYGTIDYNWEIQSNYDHVLNKTGISMTHFISPSGDPEYFGPAKELGYKVIYSKIDSYLGLYNGLPVDNPLDYESDLRIYRRYLYDDLFATLPAIHEMMDDIAARTADGTHFWWTEFTHRVENTSIGGSLLFDTFEYYMQYLNDTYGKDGSDIMWMAPLQEVYEYLRVRDQSQLSWSLDGNELNVYINVSDIPDDLRNYSLSLVIDADEDFSSLVLDENTMATFKGDGPDKLINLSWSDIQSYKSGDELANWHILNEEAPIASEEQEVEMLLYPNPVRDLLQLRLESEASDVLECEFYDAQGLLVHFTEFELNEGNNEHRFAMSQWAVPKGIYYLKAHFRNGSGKDIVQKIIYM